MSSKHTAQALERLDKSNFGFWVYLMTDLLLFGTLFATYAVLHTATAGGPSAKEIFELPGILAETLILLTSSFTVGMALLAAQQRNHRHAAMWLMVTFALGASFLALELHEFKLLVADGHSWRTSAFLSSFFTLVGTHGAHITAGLIWLAVCTWRVMKQGITDNMLRRLTILSLFWHFLDIVWIFIFTYVYLLGVAS